MSKGKRQRVSCDLRLPPVSGAANISLLFTSVSLHKANPRYCGVILFTTRPNHCCFALHMSLSVVIVDTIRLHTHTCHTRTASTPPGGALLQEDGQAGRLEGDVASGHRGRVVQKEVRGLSFAQVRGTPGCAPGRDPCRSPACLRRVAQKASELYWYSVVVPRSRLPTIALRECADTPRADSQRAKRPGPWCEHPCDPCPTVAVDWRQRRRRCPRGSLEVTQDHPPPIRSGQNCESHGGVISCRCFGQLA